MNQKLSRRDMLKGTAAGAAGLAAGLAPAMTLASAPAQDTVTLHFHQNIGRWTPVVENFQDLFPGTVVEFINVTGIDDEEVASKTLTLLASGQPLDAGKASTEVTALYAGEGIAAPLTERVLDAKDELAEYFSDMAPILPETMLWEGDLYELPDGCNAPNMFINVNMLNKAGLDMPPADWTKDDFVEYATAMTNVGGEETFGYGWPIRIWGSWGPWHYVNDTNFLTEERAPGGEWLWETFYADSDNVAHRGGGFRWPEANANDPLMVEALEFVVSLTADGLTPSIELGGGQSLSGLFLSDKVAMTPAGGYWAGGLHNNGMEKGEFDVQYWPKWKSQRHQLGVGGNWLSSVTDNGDRMWELLKFSVRTEQMLSLKGRYRPVMSTTPVRRSMVEESAYEPSGPANWQVFYDTIDRPDTYPIPSPPEASGMTGIHNRAIGLAMSGEVSPQAALDQAQAELEALLARSRGS